MEFTVAILLITVVVVIIGGAYVFSQDDEDDEVIHHVLSRSHPMSYEDYMLVRTAQAIANGSYPRWYRSSRLDPDDGDKCGGRIA